jgi:hypothetical protein
LSARQYRSRLEGEVREDLLHGPGGQIHRMTIAEAGLRYMNRRGGVKSYDDPLLKYRRSGHVILMPHTAIAARHNALSDLERLCLNLWRGIVR